MTLLTETLAPENFVRVSSTVWRGARPTLPQARYLVNLGIRTAVNLEWEEGDDGLFTGAHVRLVRVKDFEALPLFWPSLALEHVDHALAAITAGPPAVFVHCKSGQNRTGVVVAAYELRVKHRPLDAVLAHFRDRAGVWSWPDQRFIRRLAA